MIDPLSEQFPLETWFESFRRKPINELDVNDICIACRQNQADDQVLGAAIAMLCATQRIAS